MHIFDYTFLDEGVLPAGMVNLTATIAAFNAISSERKERYRGVYTDLEKIARVQSVKGSNAIEGIVTTDVRIKEIVNKNSAPLNHSEQEIAGYRDALDEIHSRHDEMAVNENTIWGCGQNLGPSAPPYYKKENQCREDLCKNQVKNG